MKAYIPVFPLPVFCVCGAGLSHKFMLIPLKCKAQPIVSLSTLCPAGLLLFYCNLFCPLLPEFRAMHKLTRLLYNY